MITKRDDILSAIKAYMSQINLQSSVNIYLVRSRDGARPGRTNARFCLLTTNITLIKLYMSMNFEIRQQQRCIEVTLRANTVIQGVNSAFSSDNKVHVKLMLNCYTVVLPQTHAANLPCPVFKSSFWAPNEVYETSHNPIVFNVRVSEMLSAVRVWWKRTKQNWCCLGYRNVTQ